MAFLSGPFDEALAAAAGDDRALLAELRAGFVASAERQVDLLRRSRCDANWVQAAGRLHALAAGFHAERLMMLAKRAAKEAPGDPAVLRDMIEAIGVIGEHGTA